MKRLIDNLPAFYYIFNSWVLNAVSETDNLSTAVSSTRAIRSSH
nr:MAG TPA: hypothetical protein [Caudoviricetes sp.]